MKIASFQRKNIPIIPNYVELKELNTLEREQNLGRKHTHPPKVAPQLNTFEKIFQE